MKLPRAKIGDVVIVYFDGGITQAIIHNAFFSYDVLKKSNLKNWGYTIKIQWSRDKDNSYIKITNQNIIYNLTAQTDYRLGDMSDISLEEEANAHGMTTKNPVTKLCGNCHGATCMYCVDPLD